MNMQPTLAALLLAIACASEAAEPELVPIQWTTEGSFVHETSVPPSKFVEVCGKLTAGTKVAWRFDATAPLSFNIHFHEGKKVQFPAKKDRVAKANGTMNIKLDQDYCWMWTNKGSGDAALKLELRRS